MIEHPAPTVEPSRNWPGLFDVTLHWNDNHAAVVALSTEELRALEAQIAAILRPPAE